MLINIVVGCSVFLLTNLSLLYSAHLLMRRFFLRSPHAVRLVGLGVLYYAFIIMLLQALSPLYAITKAGVTILCLLFTLAVHLCWGQQRNLRADIDPLRSWIRDGLRSPWAFLIVICGFVVLLSFIRALLMPPLAWDCLTYHLTTAALWVKKGALILFKAPDQIAENAYFPINGELFACWFLLPFCSDLLLNAINFPITFLGGVACYAIARELGLTRTEASFAPALICFAPLIYSQITTAYVDNATFAFFSSSVLFTLRYLRNGYRGEGCMALVAAGILLGIKYIAIPAVGIIALATAFRTVRLPGSRGFFRSSGVILLGLLIMCFLGGRQYVLNAFNAGNPVYPFPITILGHEVFQGADTLKEVNAWVAEFEAWSGLDKFSFWEREYRKFLYVILTAGPKFFFFLFLAMTGLVFQPRGSVKGPWYFLASLWIIPIIFYYANTSADFVKRAIWINSNSRFLTPFVALFTIQGLAVLQKLSPHFRKCGVFLAVLVAWDLFHINTNNLWGIEAVYPFIVLIIPIAVILFNFLRARLTMQLPGKKTFLTGYSLNKLRNACATPLIVLLAFTMLTYGLYLLQSYRDMTRYTYYRTHYDLHDFPRSLVNAWEFLDRPHQEKRIAMTVAWEPPGHTWFFYPLLGRSLQNEIMYISAKHKWDVPAWFDRGVLRGNDISIWFYNVKRNEVDYVLAVNNLVYPFVMDRHDTFHEVWPVEVAWMEGRPEKFRLVFSDWCCKIFQYLD